MKSNIVFDIAIIGGGSAGWMAASSLIKSFPNKKIVLIESPDVPTIGVGESTTQYMREWVDFLGLNDQDWMPACDATYKFGLKFINWTSEEFYYPFGFRDETACNLAEWFTYSQNNSVRSKDYGRVFYSQQAALEQNRIPHYYIKRDSGFHFDAIKFALYLKEKYAIPRGVEYIQKEVVKINSDDSGITNLILSDDTEITSNLYFDCTGFKGLLIDKTLKTGWIDFSDRLINNRTWAVQIPYKNKRQELRPYTSCTAMKNGWVWEVPTWSRIGTGYNYCDKFVNPEDALSEFKSYLGPNAEELNFRDLKWPTGVRERVWNKNVIAIGLSGGFIEPLESGGLYSVHEFLNAFLDVCEPNLNWNSISRDSFNYKCKDIFLKFSNFVELHYTMSNRSDTPYWKHYTSKENSLGNNDLLRDLFELQHHQPTDPLKLNKVWFGLSMLLGGYKYSLRNSRKKIYFANYLDTDTNLNQETCKRIWDKIQQADIDQTQYMENIDFYKEYIYKNEN